MAHAPFGHRPTTLLLRIRPYRCSDCGRIWRQDKTSAAERLAKISRTGLRWALEGLILDHLTVSRLAAGLGVAWHAANTAVLKEGRRHLIDEPGRFDGVAVLGVDEHVWRHTRRGDRYMTLIIDPTPIRDGTGLARLLDMIESRSKQAFEQWLAAREPAWRDAVQVVAMDGFPGFKTATSEELPEAVAVMDPFHVVRRAGNALDSCQRRVQQQLHGHRGRTAIALRRPPHPPHRRCLPHRATAATTRCTVRRRAAHGGRGYLKHLPAPGRRLPRTRPGRGQAADDRTDRRGQQASPLRCAR